MDAKIERPYYLSWSMQQVNADFPVQRAENSSYFMADGLEVIDMISTSFQAHFGHSEKKIINAMKSQLDFMPISPPKALYDFKTQQSDRLMRYLGLDGGKLFYTVSGGEAVENALKFVREVKNKKIVLARRKSYHGASLGALSITGDWRNHPHFTVDEWTVRIPEPTEENAIEQTRNIIQSVGPEKIAAFCLETISGTNGVIVAPRQWWDGIQDLCREFGIFLIIDEVFCGFGRTGKPFAFQHYGIKPDVVTLSKGITGGYIPFGAVWTGPEISSFYDKTMFSCGLTNYAHPVGLAAMSAVLDILEDSSFKKNLLALEKQFWDWGNGLKKRPHVKEIRGKGMMMGIETTASHLQNRLKDIIASGIFVFVKDGLWILCPPLNIEPKLLQTGLDKVADWSERLA